MMDTMRLNRKMRMKKNQTSTKLLKKSLETVELNFLLLSVLYQFLIKKLVKFLKI